MDKNTHRHLWYCHHRKNRDGHDVGPATNFGSSVSWTVGARKLAYSHIEGQLPRSASPIRDAEQYCTIFPVCPEEAGICADTKDACSLVKRSVYFGKKVRIVYSNHPYFLGKKYGSFTQIIRTFFDKRTGRIIRIPKTPEIAPKPCKIEYPIVQHLNPMNRSEFLKSPGPGSFFG